MELMELMELTDLVGFQPLVRFLPSIQRLLRDPNLPGSVPPPAIPPRPASAQPRSAPPKSFALHDLRRKFVSVGSCGPLDLFQDEIINLNSGDRVVASCCKELSGSPKAIPLCRPRTIVCYLGSGGPKVFRGAWAGSQLAPAKAGSVILTRSIGVQTLPEIE